MIISKRLNSITAFATSLKASEMTERLLPTPQSHGEPISSNSAVVNAATRHSTRCHIMSHPIYARNIQHFGTLVHETLAINSDLEKPPEDLACVPVGQAAL